MELSPQTASVVINCEGLGIALNAKVEAPLLSLVVDLQKAGVSPDVAASIAARYLESICNLTSEYIRGGFIR